MPKKISHILFIMWVIFLTAFAPIGTLKAVDLDVLMQDSGSNELPSNDKNSKALKLENLLGISTLKSTISTGQTDSLLGDIEGQRSIRKKKMAFKQNRKVRKDILSSCECLNSGGCEQHWKSGTWNKSLGYLDREGEAIRKLRKICMVTRNNLFEESSTIKDVHKSTALLTNSRDKLIQLENEMYAAATDDWVYRRSRIAEAQQEKSKILAQSRKEVRSREDAIYAQRRTADWKEYIGSWGAPTALDRMHVNAIDNLQHYQNKADITSSSGNSQKFFNQSQKHVGEKSQQVNVLYEKYKTLKKRCTDAGQTWNTSGNVCDYNRTINIEGWTQGRTAIVKRADSNEGLENNSILNSLVTSSSSNNQSKHSSSSQYSINNDSEYSAGTTNNRSNKNAENKKAIDYIPVFVQEESNFSWPTKEEACKYGKAKALEVAQKLCKEKGGVQSKQRKNDVNCQSYRQLTSNEFSSQKNQWKATGNIIFYCNTSI